MAATKKKLEVLFKAYFQFDKTTESAIKDYLQGHITGLKIKAIETFPGKSSVKAVITSNVANILLGEEIEEPPADYRRMSMLVPSQGFGMPSAPSNEETEKELAEKGKQISDLRFQLKKTGDELELTRTKCQELQKRLDDEKAKAGKDSQLDDMRKVLMEQIGTLSQQLEGVDNEKSKLERHNKELAARLEDATKKLSIKMEMNSIKAKDTTADQQLEAMEELISNKQKKFEEEKQELQDKLAVMSIKLLAEQEKTEKVIDKASKAENLDKAVSALEKEKQGLAAALQTRETDLASQKKLLDETTAKLASVEQTLKAKETEATELGKKAGELESRTAQLSSSVKALEKSKALAAKEEAAREKRISALESERSTLIEERDKLSLELKTLKEETAQFTSEKEGLKQAAAEQQKTVREREETIRDLKIQVKEKEGALHDLEAEHKSAEKQVEDLQKRADEAEKKCEALNRQLKHREKSDKGQTKDKQKIESLETEIKRREKELKGNEEACEQSKRELIVLQAKFSSTEKALASKNDEIRELKARLTGGESNLVLDISRSRSVRRPYSDFEHNLGNGRGAEEGQSGVGGRAQSAQEGA